MKKPDGDAQYGDVRYPSTKNALAELRQRYLARQITNAGATRTKPEPKTDYLYEYVPRSSGQPTKKMPVDKPSLPYYVVPVLYVPQKVLSSEEIRTPKMNFDKNATDRFIDACQKKAKETAMLNHHHIEADDFEDAYSDAYDIEDAPMGDSEKYYNYAVSVSTVNDDSISSPLLDDVNPPTQQEKPKLIEYGRYDDRQAYEGQRIKPGVYKYPTTNHNVHTLAPLAPKYSRYSSSSMETYQNFREYDYQTQKPQTAPGYTTRAYQPNYRPDEVNQIYKKTKRRHAVPSVETESVISNQTQSELLRQRKICMECLKHKHMAKEQEPKKRRDPPIAVQPFEPLNDIRRLLTDGESSGKSDPQKEDLVLQDKQRSTKDCSTGDDYQHSRCSWPDSDSKSTQTLTATKITSSTQTEKSTSPRMVDPQEECRDVGYGPKDYPIPPAVFTGRISKIAQPVITMRCHEDQIPALAKESGRHPKSPKSTKQSGENKPRKKKMVP